MPETQNIKQTLELTVPAGEVESETVKVVEELQKKVRLPGFRPGKVPQDLIRRRYQQDIRDKVVEKLIPKAFFKRAEEEGLNVVGTPSVTEMHLEPGEPLRFKAQFEVAPDIELKGYKDLTVQYQDPEISDEDVEKRVADLREQKADYQNVDPRPVERGDYAVVSLESLAGVQPPVKQDEMMLHVGGDDTMPGFTEAMLGIAPGDEKEFDVAYPEDYGQSRLAGKTIHFRAKLKAIRRKELPEINDEFARDLGDYQNLEELRGAVRNSLFAERQFLAQQEAKNKIIDGLVDMHEFPVPEAYIERQIESQVERHLSTLAAQGIDPRTLKLDWSKIKESQREKASREVKASLLISKIADVEDIHATRDEVDAEVHRFARQEREPVAAVRMKLEKEDGLRRIASRIRTEKTLNFLFEHARKTAPEAPAEPA
jgi:trigger factor